MRINIRKDVPDVLIIDVEGKLDMYNCHELKTVVNDIWNSSENTPLIFNFEGLNYIDSSGIGLLLAIFTQMMEKKQCFRFINFRGAVERIIKMVNLNDKLPIENSLEDALASIQG